MTTGPEGPVSGMHALPLRPRRPSGLASRRPGAQGVNEDPHPQVVFAFGFLITNCAPSMSSL